MGDREEALSLSRAEFQVWDRLYVAAHAAWTARLVESLKGMGPAEVAKRATVSATIAADEGLEAWRKKRKEVA